MSQKEDGNRRVHMVETEELKWTDLCGKLGGVLVMVRFQKKLALLSLTVLNWIKLPLSFCPSPFLKTHNEVKLGILTLTKIASVLFI